MVQEPSEYQLLHTIVRNYEELRASGFEAESARSELAARRS
jgi:F0F1-type ATP synthase gamma subunit